VGFVRHAVAGARIGKLRELGDLGGLQQTIISPDPGALLFLLKFPQHTDKWKEALEHLFDLCTSSAGLPVNAGKW
jgi:hypothetical protein